MFEFWKGTVSLVLASFVTVAGLTGQSGVGLGNGNAVYLPASVAVDRLGNVYVADPYNHMIRRITPTRTVTTLAGPRNHGPLDLMKASDSLSYPQGVTVDPTGNVYVADTINNRIRTITPKGQVTTLAGTTISGSADGPGPEASFRYPYGLAVDTFGNVYVADTLNNMIRKITPTGLVTTLAGSPRSGAENGMGTAASFYQPYGVAVDMSGNVYVADGYNNMIRKISPGGEVTTLAGSTTSGSSDGMGTGASFNMPFGVAADASGNVYVADTFNHMIRKISPGGMVTTIAGSTTRGSADGIRTSASFDSPWGVAVDASGNVYVADTGNSAIRKITPTGRVTTLVGPGQRSSGRATVVSLN